MFPKGNPTFLFFDYDRKIMDGYEKVLSGKIDGASFVTDDVRKIPQKYKIDAIVSPANSFGFMDGGIDKILNKMFPFIDIKVREVINSVKFALTRRGVPYLPVGKCITIPTGDSTCPYMLSVPTMFLPEIITGTDNVYLAFKSILEIYGHKKITIACCGLGTLTGALSGEDSAMQILRAYNEYYGR